MREITALVVHCSASKPSANIGATEIRRMHIQDNRWADIGYHRVIKRDGTLEFGRDDKIPGAHVSGHNAKTLAVCLVGGVDVDNKPVNNFTPSQFRTLERVLREWRIEYPRTAIRGHRDFPGVAKACPCFDTVDWCWSVRLDPEMPPCA